MDFQRLFQRYQDLQQYLNWSDDDVRHVLSVRDALLAHLDDIVQDFYTEVLRHEATRHLVNGSEQFGRLKFSLRKWLEELLSGRYDQAYVTTRWMVGRRHTRIGLHQVYTNAAMSRLRLRIHRHLQRAIACPETMWTTIESINKLLDLDLAIIEDSYEHHRLESEKLAERQRSEIKFRNLVEAAACMIVILREDGSVAYFSPFAERLTGYLAPEVTDQPFSAFFRRTDADSALWEEWQVTLARLPVTDCELAIRCDDGSFRWLAWNIIRLDDFDGAPAVLAVGHDITEKRRSAEKLLQAERLAAIGQTITGLAHESRNALQRINSCTEMLEFEVEDNPTALQLIRRLQQAQDDLARLFDEVRNFAAPIQLERASCSVPSIWREAWQLLHKERSQRQVSLIEDLEGGELTAAVDRFRMTQVFRNLFENSLAACDDPVEIYVSCRQLSAHADGSESSGGEAGVEIRVRDNGPGLSDRARREVFHPFFTTKAKGTGLGMAIAQRILTVHGGTIAVGEPSSCGAEFVLVLPRNLS